jgi:ATP-binding cassette subfamily A (ABC1) protein 3
MPPQNVDPFDNFIGKPNMDVFELYNNDGYAAIHNWLANFVLRKQFPGEKNGKLPTIANLIVPMQANDYNDDDFARVLPLLSFFMFLTYIVPLYRCTYRIVNEKETRARESMKMMGLTDSSYWLSWLTYFAMVVTMISLISTIMLGSILKSDSSVTFVLFWIYGISLFGYCLIVQSLFDKARTAGGFVATLYFVASFFDNLVNKPYHDYTQKTLASILSPVALNRCVYVMSVAEGTVGLNWSNIGDEYQNYNFRNGMLMMIAGGIITSAIGLYLDNVI